MLTRKPPPPAKTRARAKAPPPPSPIKPEHRMIGRAVAAALRQDGWENTYTGLGVAGTDKTTGMRFVPCRPRSYEELSALFHGDDLAFKVCALQPQTALRQGATFTRKAEPVKVPVKPPTPPIGAGPGVAPKAPKAPVAQLKQDADPLAAVVTPEGADAPGADTGLTGNDPEAVQAQAKALRAALCDLGIFASFQQAATFGRAFGGAALILGLPGAPTSPAPTDASELVFVTVVDSSELRPYTWYEDPLAPHFGRPELYEITPKSAGGQVKQGPKKTIHESRLILFGGALTTRQVRAANSGWDLSVLQKCLTVLEQLNTILQSTTYMVSDVSQSVLKTPDLIGAIGQMGFDAIQERIALLDRTRSVARTLAIDTTEEFSHQERGALSFLADTIDRFFLRFASAADTPVTLLFRQSPAGMDATGASDIRLWYDQVQTFRTEELEPQLRKIVQVVSRGLFPDVDPSTWEVVWPSLWQTTPTEEADYQNKIAQTDKIYYDIGAVMPEEITQTRFGSGKFDAGPIKIDLKARAESLAAEQEAMQGLQQAGALPGGVPDPGLGQSGKALQPPGATAGAPAQGSAPGVQQTGNGE